MKNTLIIFPQSRRSYNNNNHSHPIKLDPKPQIESIPGVSLKRRDRYRVTLGDEILGDRLDIDQALELAKGGKA
ncbi:MAG TPA: hypothetical protein V6D14_17570 [Coleofasciculaceae cyanobacterium]|jgi:hypothetical protein